MARGAAFFDLDRTLLKGASGPLLNEALVEAGVVPDRSVPGLGLVYRWNDLLGESLPSMALARGAAFVARGWPAEAVREAAKEAAHRLKTLVTPYARPLIEEHRRAGRPVVLATTTPHDLVRPLADALGFDDVVATRYAEQDGRFTGRLEGEFVWAAGKRNAVRRWAADHDVDLRASYAYSDSFYDVPLLSSVGHPHAVNPDPRLRAVAVVRRWPVLHLDAPPGVPKIFGLEPFDVLRLFALPQLYPYVRFEFHGLDRLPKRGPAIVAANHRSYFDPLALSLAVLRAGRAPRFLGKKEVFDAPVLGQVARALGQIRVDREGDGGGAAAMREAVRALRAGEVVALMPQATIPRGEAFFDPVLRGKTGAARLAAQTKAPVIPVGLWGTEHVWPRSQRLPNVTNVVHPPTVTVTVGPPVALAHDDPARDTERIMEAIADQLPPEARRPHTPSAEELDRTIPANVKGG